MASLKSNTIPRWRISSGERRIILLIGDLLMASLAFVLALYFWAQRDWLNFSFEFLSERIPGWFFLLPVLWIFLLVDLYDVRKSNRRSDTLRGLAFAGAASSVLYLVVFFISEPNSLPRRGVAIFLVSVTILTLLWRFLYIQIFTAPMFMRRVLIVGAGRAGSTLVQVAKDIYPPPFLLVGLIDDDPEKLGQDLHGYKVLGGSTHLLDIIEQEGVTDVVFAINVPLQPESFTALLEAEERGIEVVTMPHMYEELLGRVPIFLLQSDWVLRSFVDQAHSTGFYEVARRLLDLAGAIVGIILLVLLTPLITLAILLDDGRPIFYSQPRVGRFGQVYRMTKFRTMRNDPSGKQRMTGDKDDRITRVGKILRRSHLDELPQFVNILLGEMSLVGPRAEQPALVDEFTQQIPFYRARLFVNPGLTGWAQINMVYAANVEETAIKLEYDLYYIKHRNLLLDFTIILRTVFRVIGLRGH
jgi:exopolysaccharide biosynthesis polyprenyl glycosylphosphotransferase